jgi:hemoglobin
MREGLHSFIWNNDASALPALFKLFDLNGDGCLSHEELHKVLNACFSDYIPINEITAMVQEADADGNGTVEIDEFVAVMEKHKTSGKEQGWDRLHLFEKIGGKSGIKAIVDKMYEKVVGDNLLAPWFSGKDVAKVIAAQYAYIEAAVGGPSPWTGRSLTEIHAGMQITEPAMERYANLFQEAALETGKTPEEAKGIKDTIHKFSPHIVGRTRANLNARSRNSREHPLGTTAEQLDFKNKLLSEHLGAAIYDAASNAGALADALAANKAHDLLLEK